MSIESSANNISQLNHNWPSAEDFVSEGDDHIRLLKQTIKQTFPNIKNAVSISDVQLNSLAKTVSTEDTGSDLTINGNLVVQKDGYGFIGKTDFKVSELTDKTIINYKMLQELVHPVGTIVTLNTATNPRDLWGFGSWQAFGSGRVLISSGSTTDSRGESRSFSLGASGGEYQHVLVESEIAHHAHSAGSLHTNDAGSHRHDSGVAIRAVEEQAFGVAQMRPQNHSYEHHKYYSNIGNPFTDTTGVHNHTVVGTTTGTGGNGAHNNMQPFVVVHMWLRVA